MEKRNSLRRSAFADFEAVIGAFLARLAETKRVHEEALRLGDFANREHWAVEAARGDVFGDFLGSPGIALVRVFLEHFQLNARRVIKANKFLPKALLNPPILYVVAIQMFEPEFQRTLGHCIRG